MILTLVGVASVFLLLLLILVGVPIAFAMGGVGLLGILVLEGSAAAMAHAALVPWDEARSFVLVTIPLFVLMGQLVFHTGLATELYDGLRAWIGWVPGGMAITSVLACGGFGAVTGSSIATVATMGAIVMPEMDRFGYDRRLATGALAASGTLGILIPPSVIFIFYGVITETSIGALFIAGIIPGILTAAMFSAIIFFRCILRPELGPPGPVGSWPERLDAVKRLGPILAFSSWSSEAFTGGSSPPLKQPVLGAAASWWRPYPDEG